MVEHIILSCTARWVERLRVVGLQRQQQQQPESPTHQPFRVPSGPPTPAFGDGSGYDFPLSTLSPWSSPPASFDAPSPGVSYGLGGLTLGKRGASIPGSTNSTPRNGLQDLPEEEGQQPLTEAVRVKDNKVERVEVEIDKDVSESSPLTLKPDSEAVGLGMDIDS
jgi:hypothetical protein